MCKGARAYEPLGRTARQPSSIRKPGADLVTLVDDQAAARARRDPTHRVGGLHAGRIAEELPEPDESRAGRGLIPGGSQLPMKDRYPGSLEMEVRHAELVRHVARAERDVPGDEAIRVGHRQVRGP